MKCDLKIMLRVGGILAFVLAGGYFFFPQFRPVLTGLAPFALFALCPISMFFAMWGMNKGQHNHSSCVSCVEENHKKHAKTS